MIKSDTTKSAGLTTKPKGCRAFTLVEIIIALSIVSIALLGLLKLQMVNIRTADATETMNQCAYLAQAKLAELTALDYLDTKKESGILTIDNRKFRWQSEVVPTQLTLADGIETKGLRKIVIEVRRDKPGSQKIYRLATYLADRSLQ